MLWSKPDGSSGSVQYVRAVDASVDASQVASVARASCPEAFAQRPRPFQALTASDEDSWLLPSANGDVPEAHEWPAYGSKDRSCGSCSEGVAAAMSCASRFITGARSDASALSPSASSPAADRMYP